MSPERISRLLPAIYQNDPTALAGPLGDYLAAMAGLHEPTERLLDSLDEIVNPLETGQLFLPMLGAWLDLDRYLDWPAGRVREGSARFAPGPDRYRLLLSLAPELRSNRGRPATLVAFLETVTGLTGFSVEDDERPFHVLVRAPSGARRFRDLIERIVDQERPAFTTFAIDFADEPAPSPSEEMLDG